MTKLLLSIHVLAAILAIGPVAVAASMFPAAIRRRAAGPPEPPAQASAPQDFPAAGSSIASSPTASPSMAGVSTASPATGASVASASTASGASPLTADTGTDATFAAGEPADGLATARVLHRICRVYAAVGVVVPVFGLATASSLGVLTDVWLLVSIGLTIAAAAVLVLLVLPGQRSALATGSAAVRRLAMYTGTFNLLWAIVTVLMITRPGSTTGA